MVVERGSTHALTARRRRARGRSRVTPAGRARRGAGRGMAADGSRRRGRTRSRTPSCRSTRSSCVRSLATSLRPSAFPADARPPDRGRARRTGRGWRRRMVVVAAGGCHISQRAERLGGARRCTREPRALCSTRSSRAEPVEPAEEPSGVARRAARAAAPPAPARGQVSEPASESPGGGSLVDQGVRIALAGAAVVVGLTIEVVRVVLRKR